MQNIFAVFLNLMILPLFRNQYSVKYIRMSAK